MTSLLSSSWLASLSLTIRLCRRLVGMAGLEHQLRPEAKGKEDDKRIEPRVNAIGPGCRRWLAVCVFQHPLHSSSLRRSCTWSRSSASLLVTATEPPPTIWLSGIQRRQRCIQRRMTGPDRHGSSRPWGSGGRRCQVS